MSDNFVSIELSYYSDLVRSKGRLEAIIDCLLESNIPKYNRYDANKISNLYVESKNGIRKDSACDKNYRVIHSKKQSKKEEK